MSESDAATILARRFPAKRGFITGAASGLGRALAQELAAAGWQLGPLDLSAPGLAATEAELRGAGPATDAARAILAAAARGRLHIVWPGKYRVAWLLKRLFPAWFVTRVARVRDRRPSPGAPQPG